MRIHTRIVWETHWELDARMRTCTHAAQRDALRMLHTLRRHPAMSDSELADFIGRTTNEVWSWWRIYEHAGLTSLLLNTDGTPWLIVDDTVIPEALQMSSRSLGQN